MKYLIFFSLLISLVSCKRKENQNDEVEKNKVKPELKIEREVFDKELIKSLYKELNSGFEVDFSRHHLANFLNNINISELQEGKEFEKAMLFEDFQCDCYDKMKISYSKSNNRFILQVYEEFYEEDLDWCPESSYSYSFIIRNHNIIDLKLDFMAG